MSKQKVITLQEFLNDLWEREAIGPRTLTPSQAADYLGVGVHVVRRLVHEGYLLTVPNLPGMRISVQELERFVDRGVKKEMNNGN